MFSPWRINKLAYVCLKKSKRLDFLQHTFASWALAAEESPGTNGQGVIIISVLAAAF